MTVCVFPIIIASAQGKEKPAKEAERQNAKAADLHWRPHGGRENHGLQANASPADHCVFLDGDWCWDGPSFINTPETRAMAVDNIRHLLNGFLGCTAMRPCCFAGCFTRRISCRLSFPGLERAYRLYTLSLVCPATTLAERLWGDVGKGLRQPDVIERSLNRLPLYQDLGWPLLDTAAAPPARPPMRPWPCCGRRGPEYKKTGKH